jgi:hypothetical protein
MIVASTISPIANRIGQAEDIPAARADGAECSPQVGGLFLGEAASALPATSD